MKTKVDLSRLRHPRERPVWVVAVLLNAVICAGAVAIVIRGGTWIFVALPFLERYEVQIRGIALAAVLAPPTLVFVRNRRLARVRGNGLEVSATQYPLLHAHLLAHCEKLGVEEPPTLYVSERTASAPAHAFSSWHREFIVLGDDYLEADLEPLRDVTSFLLGRELGRLGLGHVRWWDELLVSYVDRLPLVRYPLRHVRSYSLDHVGAYVEPEGVRGLVIQASGRRALPTTDIAEQIRYSLSVGGFWVLLSNLVDEHAHLAVRLRNLYERGLFDLEHDLDRFGRTGSRHAKEEVQ